MRHRIFNNRTFVIVAAAVVGFMFFILYFIVPKLKRNFEDLGIEPSSMTVLLIWISDMVVSYFYLAPVIVLALYLLSLRNRTSPDRAQCA